MLHFHLVRVWILLGHAVAFAFSFGVAVLHVFFLREPYVGNNLTQIDPTIPTLYRPTIMVFALNCVGHVVLLVYALAHTFRVISKPRGRVQPAVSVLDGTRKPKLAFVGPAEVTVTHGLWLRGVKTQVARHRVTVLSFWRRHNAEITRIFILWEVANQTFQANKMSQLITSKWINRLVAIVIISNCWFSPILHYFLGAHPKTYVRLTRLLVDSCLDMVYNVGIPLTIFYPYYSEYIGGLNVFRPELFFTDTWYINAVSELRQVFITSYLDLLSKITGGFALQYRLYTILNAAGDAEREATGRSLAVTRTVHTSRLSRVLDVILVAWGVTVLTLHAHAAVTSSRNRSAGCLLEMQPWGSSQYTCAALEVSCSHWRITGDRDTLSEAIQSANPRTMQMLILSHCPAIQVPPVVQRLTNLLTIKIYNSTVSEWAEDAALTSIYHPRLQSLYCARIQMPTIPPGLLSSNFPPIWAIFFSLSNVTHFPDSVASTWRTVTVLAIEGNPAFHTIPRSVLNLPRLTIAGFRHNGITEIPDDGLAPTSFIMLDLAVNPLAQLPESIGSLDTLQFLDIRATNVSKVPVSWSQLQPTSTGRPPVLVEAGGSPLCDNKTAIAVPWLALQCTTLTDASLAYGYPIHDEDMWRQASR
jgi:hypothetical protein